MVLPFAVQPVHFNPGSFDQRKQSVAFAGGFYGDELPERSRITIELLSGLQDNNLIIYDRFWHRNKATSFPDQFAGFSVPGVKPEKVADVYSKHALYLNINTVTNSPTMLSRRVFELAASGACIISNPSTAMKKYFGDLIPEISTSEQARDSACRILESPGLQRRLGSSLQEVVMENHTWQHRLNQIVADLGI